ncbi:MAG TPA: enoyl-CoA hydratase/isomerase family protein, partial [Gemmatimonadales bacterium]
ELTRAIEQAALDSAARIVVLRGAGKDFCAGLDLDEFYRSADAADSEHRREADQLAGLLGALLRLPQPSLSLVQGKAMGIGATLAVACDLVIASDSAVFAFPEVTYGFVPAFAAAIVPRLIGERAAFELLVTGRLVRGEEARGLGLASRLVPEEGFEAVTGSVVRGLCTCAVDTLAAVKGAFRAVEGKPLTEALNLSAAINARARASAAFKDAAHQFFSMA